MAEMGWLRSMEAIAARMDARPNDEVHFVGSNLRQRPRWQMRFVDWFRDLGSMDKPEVETKASRDVAA